MTSLNPEAAGFVRIDRAAITARNATASPLLRLPGELRNAIWRFAMEDIVVEVHSKQDSRPLNLQIKHPVPFYIEELPKSPLIRFSGNGRRLRSAFTSGLAAGICRQIRAETRDLQFRHATFKFESSCAMYEFCRHHAKHRRLAIEDVTLSSLFAHYTDYGIPFKYFFPNLKRVVVDPKNFLRGCVWANKGTELRLRRWWPKTDTPKAMIAQLLRRLAINDDCKGLEFYVSVSDPSDTRLPWQGSMVKF